MLKPNIRDLKGNDIGSGSVCFDFRSTNVVQLSMSLRLPNGHRRQPITEPERMSLPLIHLSYSKRYTSQ